VTTPPNWVSDLVPPPVLEVMKKAVAPDPHARWPSADIFYEKLAEAAAPALQGETSQP